MRTTVSIDDHLIKQLKQAALSAGVLLRQIINTALRLGLSQMQEPVSKGRRYRLKTFSMGRPKVMLDKALALSSLLEDEEIAGKRGLENERGSNS
jgi:hypothetical protein